MKPGGFVKRLTMMCVLAAAAGAMGGEVTVATRGGRPACTIVTAANPTESVKYAAEELRDFLARSTGVTLPVVTAPGADPAIFVGPGAGPESDALGRDLGSDGFRLVAKPPHVYVCGSGVRGALYGVYAFLERFAGCGFYASWHTVVPKRDRIAVPDGFDVTEKPVFTMREPFWWDVMQHPEFAARIRVNTRSFQKEADTPAKFGGTAFKVCKRLPLCHTFEKLMPNAEFFKTHPEYFSFENGKRIDGRNQLCLTNPDVLRIVTERVKAEIRKEPDATCFGVSQNDWAHYCQCPACKAVDDEEGGPAGTVIRFVNAVAAEVEKEFPDVIIETLAYWYSRQPPKKTRPRRNVAVCLCSHECDFARPLDRSSDGQSVKFCRELGEWAKICDRLLIWDYTTDFHYYTSPFPNVKSLQGNIRLFRDNNVRYVFEQGGCQGRHADFAELKTWLIARWLWNPELPEKELLDEFFAGYYGAGAPFVREYFEELHGRNPDKRMGCYTPVTENPALSDEFLWRAKDLWRKAEAATADDPACSYNVRMGAFSVDYALCERLPESDPRVPGLARSLLDRMDEAKDICICCDALPRKARLARWRRLVGDDIDPLVSLFINSTSLLPGDAHCISAMRRLNRDYGLRRFFFDPPGLRRPLGNADHALHVKIGESFKAAKEAMPGCEICWFVRPVLCWSAKQEGQHIMDADGNVSSGLCPLDDAANEPYYDNIRTVAKIADIPMYLIEDDLNLSGHPGLKNRHGGCFCPLHLAALEKKIGRRYTAKELGAIFDAPTKENEPVRIAFADVSRDSLARFCRKVRAAIDSVSPKARTMLFQSAQVDIDGDTTEADARALAGTTRPSVRVYGAAYFCQNVPEVLPMVTAHTFYTMQHLPDDIEKFYEADCFPQSRFYNSTLFYLSEIGAAFMAGADDLLMFTARSADDPFADTAYFDMIRANRPRFAALKAFGRRSSVVGVRAVYDAQVNRLYRERGSKMLDESARLLAKFGFPMTTKPSGATVLFGETAHRLSETQLKEMFKGAVLVDSTAALRLTERGFGGWLGCSVKYAEDELEFARSRVLPVAGSRVNGLNPYDYHILEPVTPVPGWDMKMDYVRITPGTSSETWVRYEDTEGRTVAPSFVVSKNPLGGTTAVMSFAVKDNFREWLYSPEMQDVWRNFFDRATGGALDVTATRAPSTWLAARVSDDGKELLVMVNNLAGEPRSDIALEFSKKWRGGQVEQLQMDGAWRPVGTASEDFRPAEGFTYAAMTPEFFKVTLK